MKRKTTEEFIAQAKIVHPNYSYEKTLYLSDKLKVEIICLIHGSFCQTPSAHLQGAGCPKCRGGVRSNTEEFVQKAVRLNGEKFDYARVVYINASKKVEIGCKKCGKYFFQTPNHHLNGDGCSFCYEKRQSNTEEFVQKAIKVHRDDFDYSKVEYKTAKTKIEIICRKCGSIFEQTPNEHLNGRGCMNCALLKRRSDTEEFIKKAIKLNGKRFDYSKVDYKDSRTKVEIICNKCGKTFWQQPNGHLNGRGCAYCISLISKVEIKWLNELNIPEEYRQFRLKIGETFMKVDGFVPETNTVYEFFGDYWHGNPKKFKANEKNHHNKRTFGELYIETENKIKTLKENGYNVIYIWEFDYLKQMKLKKRRVAAN